MKFWGYDGVNMGEACWVINEGFLGMGEHMGEWEWLQEAINSQAKTKTTKYMHQHLWSNDFPDLRDGKRTKVWNFINQGIWVVRMIKLESLEEFKSPKHPINKG